LFLLDPIYNQKELNILRSNCSVYIHGHSAGGTNPSLVEAMYLELPVIAFDVSYNRATTENSCLYFKDAKELIHVVQQTDKPLLKAMGNQLYQIAKRRYTWKVIADKYAYLIELFAFDYTKQSIFNPLQNLDAKLLRKYGLAHFKNLKMFYE
jgi:glycosyltransferase involved in cell wall biosynthesis